jgi:pimeloyl-ACP methyl ester carboxylesterase
MRVVLIHGSVGNASVWSSTRRELEPRFEVVTPTRGGYPPGPLLDRIDFERQAEELAPELGEGAHLVGHSYGGVISLLIAAAHPERVRSLAVSEPPAFGVARGNPVVDDRIATLADHFEHGPSEPRAFAEGFLALVGSELRLPDPLPPGLEQGIRATRAERLPWEAEIPLDELAAAPFPKLVVSGAHDPAFDAVCDVLEQRLGAERAVLPGAGHSLMRAPGYPERIAAFVDDSVRTEQSAH